MRRATVTAAVLAALILALGGCATTGTPAPDTVPGAAAPGAALGPQTLTVYAAASLTAAFDDLAMLMEQQNPSVEVDVTYDGSATLATQIESGAPADVFASADEKNMTVLTEQSLVGPATLFAANTLRIAVAPGNPRGIETLDDLAEPNTITVLCAPQVPCGAASAALLANASVTVTAASEEQNVTAVVTKVAEGEADAGLVYATDIAANPDRLEGITPAGADAVVGHYPIGVVAGSRHAAAAQAFVDLVLSEQGQAVLGAAGFLAP
ncbi:molybdate ABC transporter substrate-binding protein [Cryobacterium melibiosiphilum]|uniref:Molybdate ABC transporter substrate-binding protein n=1 Tax=Cryobacterium melibiosiphilum TaxID=995039 RepID=A0A3A5MUH5_9MICO|nr:molybdate ABC transporter substrate-binding protein [Cryobacterium melibiosiphilum]